MINASNPLNATHVLLWLKDVLKRPDYHRLTVGDLRKLVTYTVREQERERDRSAKPITGTGM